MNESDGATPPMRRIPPWAWGAIGVALGATIVGGLWLAYESGRGAARAQRGGTATTTATAVAGAATPTPAPVTAPTGTGDAIEDPPAPQTPAPSVPATKAPAAGGFQLGNALALQHGGLSLPSPKTWKTVYMTSGGGGSWSGPSFSLAKGQVRLKLKVISGNDTYLWFGLGRVTPSKDIAWMWGTDHATNQDLTTPAMAVEAGEYRLETLGTPNWEISLQQ